MITEEAIDRVIQHLEANPPDMDVFLERLEEDRPEVAAYLASADYDILTDAEYAFLLYLAVVLIEVEDRGDFDEEKTYDSEEALWGEVMETPNWSIEHEALRVADEDAWGIFLIDTLAPDEDSTFLSPQGIAVIWVKLKALAAGFLVN